MSFAGFTGLLKTKPAKFRGILNKPGKPRESVSMDGLCRFAGLFPVGEPRKQLEIPLNGKRERFVDKSSIYPHEQQEKTMHKRKQSQTTVEPLFLTIPQVAAMLGLGRSKVYDLIREEGLPTAKFGTATRVPVKELQEWAKQRIA